MKDGIIKADGTSRRVKATFPATYEEFRAQAAAGTLSLDVLFQAAGWSQQPTFLNKGNLLDDTTAALFGLNEAGVPNQALSFLGKYNQHWWRRRSYIEDTGYAENQVEPENFDYWLIWSNTSVAIQYADSIKISGTGAISLVSPASVTLTINNVDEAENLIVGKYLYFWGRYWYLPPTGYLTYYYDDESYNHHVSVSKDIVEVQSKYFDQSRIGPWDAVWSTERNAYPDKGISDNYEYWYIGKPFENFSHWPAKIESGSYLGTGTSGAANPNSLTFEFAPKIVFIIHATYGAEQYACILLPDGTAGVSLYMPTMTGSINNRELYNSRSGNTVTWYSEDGADDQANTESVIYNYVALG